jgi:hypothetical protein
LGGGRATPHAILRSRGGSGRRLFAPLLGSSCSFFLPLLLQLDTLKISCTLSLAFLAHSSGLSFLLALRSLRRREFSFYFC